MQHASFSWKEPAQPDVKYMQKEKLQKNFCIGMNTAYEIIISIYDDIKTYSKFSICFSYFSVILCSADAQGRQFIARRPLKIGRQNAGQKMIYVSVGDYKNS